MSRKLRWMPGRPAASENSEKCALAQNAEPKWAATCAPMAKKATKPRSSSPAKPTTMFRPSAIVT